MVNFESPLPLHVQLKDLIKTEIVEGKYTEKIPSERELMERFSISRSTVRESVNHLVREGVLQKIHGKGTFLTTKKALHDWLNTLNSFTETVRQMGMKPGAKLLTAELVDGFDEGTAILGESKLYTIARLRTANNLPIAIERHYYTKSLGEQLTKFDLDEATIYDLIEKELNIVIVEAEQTIRCCPISAEDANFLNIEAGINVLCVERVLLGIDGQVIEYYISLFHPDLYSLKLKTKRAMRGAD